MFEGIIAFLVFGFAAVACTLAGLWIATKGASERTDRPATLFALVLTGVWSLCAASLGHDSPLASMSMIGATLAWLFVLLRLFGNDGRDESIRVIRPLLLVLGFVQMLQVPLIALYFQDTFGVGARELIFETLSLFKVLVAVGALSLVHNLYAGAASTSRKLLTWTSIGLALFWGWSLNANFVFYLLGESTVELVAIQALVISAMALCVAMGSTHASANLEFRPSRAVAFQSLSLGLIAVYLVALFVIAELAGRFSGDLGRIVQVSFLFCGAAMAVLWLPSERLRRWLRVEALKHLFKHRYDYRNEWIRFTHTIGRTNDSKDSLQERAIQSLADITGCQAGLLLLRDEDGCFNLAARWRWNQAAVPADGLPAPLIKIFEQEQLILDFSEVRNGVAHHGEIEHLPEWLCDDPQLWAAVPLLHHGMMVGLIVLAKPDVARPLDWEDFDLLAVAGQQVASYLAEQAGQNALNEASQFDEFNRRMAFVLHDIKNLSSQMSLLLRNAERHADNPEFRKDMLVTLRNSADKLNTMLVRLGRYKAPGSEDLTEIDLAKMARALADSFAASERVTVQAEGPCVVIGEKDSLQQSLAHLVQNALDASDDDGVVEIHVSNTGLRGAISIIDQGKGMSAAFVRNELFRPFSSSKDGGFGIGAYEARTMIRGMGGRLSVESQEALGSRFEVNLPLSAAAKFIEGRVTLNEKPESEAA